MTMSGAQRRRSGSGAAAWPSHREVVRGLARLGFLARGVVYVLVGVLAVRIALGHSGQPADRSGALQTVAGTSFGAVLLWLLAVGFGGMAVWRASEAAAGAPGSREHETAARAVAGARAVFYAVVCYSVVRLVADHRAPSSTDQQSGDVTAQVLHHSGGQWLIGIAGAVIAAAGVAVLVRGIRRKFEKHLALQRMSPRTRKVVRVLGVVGYVARGLVFAALGAFLIDAAVTSDPTRARGLDGSIRAFAQTPAGPWGLGALAVALAAFGAFSFCQARWRRL